LQALLKLVVFIEYKWGEGIMKKVLFMLSSMNIGGVEKSFLSLLSKMPKEKYDITLLLLEKKGGFLKQVPDWIKVEEAEWFRQVKPIIMQSPQKTISDYKANKAYHKIPAFIYSYILSEKLFKDRYMFYKNVFKIIPKHKETFDIAISYQGPTDIIDYYIANRVRAKRKISWVHFDITKHKINEKLYEKLYEKLNDIFVVSKTGEKKLIERIPSVFGKTKVFMNIISHRAIKEMSEKDVFFDEDYNGKRIVTVGRLSEEKGQDIAIKVLSRLRKDGYDVRWYCVGEGKQRHAYEQLIEAHGLKKDFVLLGSAANPYPFISRSDIYVQPSRHEGFCLTLAEAKSLNKPIVTTNFTGADEQIKNDKTGLVVDVDEEQVYQAIKKLINNPSQCRKLSANLMKEAITDDMQVKVDL
jgi:glycosyltransferase involved in cell wall biosynthesis